MAEIFTIFIISYLYQIIINYLVLIGYYGYCTKDLL